MSKKHLKFCIVNTLFAFLLFFIFQKSHLLPGENNKLFFLGPIVKNKISSKTKDLKTESFLFINTSYDRMLVTHYDNLETKPISQAMPRGNVAILDREKLTRFFNKLNNQPNHRYLVCDIIFDYPSHFDTVLGSSMQKSKRMVIAQGESVEKIIPSMKNLNFGLNEIYTHSGATSKYRLFEKIGDTISKSIPLKMYEEIYTTKIKPGYFFSRLGSKAIFNDFTPENYIKKSNVSPKDLGDIIKLPDHLFKQFIDDKIIVLGDFYTDSKKTIYNTKTPGSILLMNIFLSLEEGSNKISIGLIIFISLVFLFFSYLVIAPQNKTQSKIFNIPLIGALLGGMRYIIATAIFSLIIYFIFGNNISLIYMGVFFYLENLIIHRRFHYLRIKKRLNIK